MNEQVLTPGMYLQARITQKTREVAARHDAGLVAMWPEAIKEVMAEFPNLSAEQRANLKGNVQGQVKLLAARTGRSAHDFTPALEDVARILGS